MNPRVLLRSPGFLPERQLLKSSTQSLTSHLARPPSLNFQKSFLFVASSSSGNSGRRTFSSSSAGRFMDGGSGVVGGGGSGGEGRKGSEGVEGVEGVDEGGEKGWGCGEEGENEGDGRGSGEYRGVGVSSDSGVRELGGSGDVGAGTPRQSPAKRSAEPGVTPKGKLLPTPSRLLKLLLPLKPSAPPHPINSPLALLVHPQQPLSYLERLIQAELPPVTFPNSPPRAPNICFKTLDLGSLSFSGKSGDGGHVRWSTSTEVGEFVRNMARGKEFIIEVEGRDDVPISMPSFRQRTHYLRQRLVAVAREIELRARLKSECDRIAHRGVQRVAVSGISVLVGWLAGVYWLTFKTSLGWAVMELVTYLVGLSTIMGAYLLFLYNNREALHRSVLDMTVIKRQTKLYREKGFDIDKWEELVNKGKAFRREIKAIAEEYDVDWDERGDEVDRDGVGRLLNED